MDNLTDREMIIKIDSNLDNLGKSVERLAKAIESLETNKLAALDRRIEKLEKFMNEWGGVIKIASVGALLLSAYAAIKFH